jgi:hypothetical protein
MNAAVSCRAQFRLDPNRKTDAETIVFPTNYWERHAIAQIADGLGVIPEKRY